MTTLRNGVYANAHPGASGDINALTPAQVFPHENPCKSETRADQIAKCIGDMTNFEILVDTASLNDGTDVGLSLSEATTELMLIGSSGSKVHLWTD